jgi:hypothetical protein
MERFDPETQQTFVRWSWINALNSFQKINALNSFQKINTLDLFSKINRLGSFQKISTLNPPQGISTLDEGTFFESRARRLSNISFVAV